MTDPFDGAVCRNHDPDRWFDPHPHEMEAAQHLCRGCPLVTQCLQLGLNETFGIWGATTPAQRSRLRRQTA